MQGGIHCTYITGTITNYLVYSIHILKVSNHRCTNQTDFNKLISPGIKVYSTQQNTEERGGKNKTKLNDRKATINRKIREALQPD